MRSDATCVCKLPIVKYRRQRDQCGREKCVPYCERCRKVVVRRPASESSQYSSGH